MSRKLELQLRQQRASSRPRYCLRTQESVQIGPLRVPYKLVLLALLLLLVERTSRSSSSATDRRTPRTAARRTAPPALRAHDGRAATCGSDAAALEARCADAALEPAGTRAASQSRAPYRQRRVVSALACASGLDGREERDWDAHGSLREHVGHDVEPHRRAADVDLHHIVAKLAHGLRRSSQSSLDERERTWSSWVTRPSRWVTVQLVSETESESSAARRGRGRVSIVLGIGWLRCAG